MEQLHKMLIEYNTNCITEECRRSWSDQFREQTFPCYWQVVFEELQPIDKSKKVLEIGCGQGDVTSILCYQGFKLIKAYEMDKLMSEVAIRKLDKLFGRTNIVTTRKYPQETECADILILVNCAYADGCNTKDDYKRKIYSFYKNASEPELLLLEVIDPKYNIPDENFPYCLRLNDKDIKKIFPTASIRSYETYRYPKNKRTKRLYVIKHSK